MTIELVFAASLAAAVLMSARAHRTVLSTSVLFLLVGFVTGSGVLGWIQVGPEDPVVHRTTEIALVTVLFTDAMRLPLPELRRDWSLAARLLGVASVLTVVIVTLAGRWLVGLGWWEAVLLAAVLAPTDPLLAAAIVGRNRVPRRVRRAINVESGLNDGLALPLVVVSLTHLGSGDTGLLAVLIEVGAGVALGVVIPLVVIFLERLEALGASERYRPLLPVSVVLLVFGVSSVVHANVFVSAFVAGVVTATYADAAAQAFEPVGGVATEVLKLFALLLFGALVTPTLLTQAGIATYLFAISALVIARPASVTVALAGSALRRRERLAMAWFGPKGFASVTYGLLVLRAGIPAAPRIFVAGAVTIALSIIAHASSDVWVANRFEEPEARDDSRRSLGADACNDVRTVDARSER
jgi:NhaP-type Na+/H+ or K+/H+ antiporter